jgi:hypothetical protein
MMACNKGRNLLSNGFIKGDQKISVHLMITKQKVTSIMFKVSPASLQTFIDTLNCVLEDWVQYSTVHIPNVFCDGHLRLIKCVGDCSDTLSFSSHRNFLIALYMVLFMTIY